MSAAVNKPTNSQQKDADIKKKLQLYGIYSGTRLVCTSRVKDSN